MIMTVYRIFLRYLFIYVYIEHFEAGCELLLYWPELAWCKFNIHIPKLTWGVFQVT